MGLAIRTPQQLIEPLRRLIAPARPEAAKREQRTDDRVLDAALTTFSNHGVRATTMAMIAREAGISREWLYKLFANRDALILEVTRREIASFIDALAVRAFESDDFSEAVTDVFIHGVEIIRDHALLQRVLRTETEVLNPRVLEGAGKIGSLAVEATAVYLATLGDLEARRAELLAESLVRLVGSIIAAPRATFDLHDPDELREYATVTVPALVHAARTAPIRR